MITGAGFNAGVVEEVGATKAGRTVRSSGAGRTISQTGLTVATVTERPRWAG